MFLRSIQHLRFKTQTTPIGPFSIAIRFEGSIRSLATNAALKKHNENAEISWENAKPYAELPTIGKWEMIRGLMPGGGFHNKSLHAMIGHFWKKYGDIFKMPGMFGAPDTVVIMNPADFAVMFRNEGKWPERVELRALMYYRQVYREDFFQGIDGFLLTKGEQWSKSRTAVNPILVQQKNAELYLDALQNVSEELLHRIREVRDPNSNEMPPSFEEDLIRLALESVLVVIFNKQLGIIRKNRDDPGIRELIDAIPRFFELTFILEFQPNIWRYVKTRKFNELMEIQNIFLNFCIKYSEEAMASAENDARKEGQDERILEKLARIDRKMPTIIALDMITAGLDTTTGAIYGILLCLSKNPEVQQKLFNEIIKILPEKNSKITSENITHLSYLRAVIKEALRFYPIVPGTLRKLPVDVVLSGYQVPKGVRILHGGMILMLDENYLPSANDYRPERFLRHNGRSNELSGQINSPFMYLPFGFGPRMCVGKRIVNMEMEITIARLVRNFHIEYNYPTENAFTARFFNVPNLPMKFKFTEREY